MTIVPERWLVGAFEATARVENFPRSGRGVSAVGAAGCP
jgi:hypothetical protein